MSALFEPAQAVQDSLQVNTIGRRAGSTRTEGGFQRVAKDTFFVVKISGYVPVLEWIRWQWPALDSRDNLRGFVGALAAHSFLDTGY
jgi:hypothetical protein